MVQDHTSGVRVACPLCTQRQPTVIVGLTTASALDALELHQRQEHPDDVDILDSWAALHRGSRDEIAALRGRVDQLESSVGKLAEDNIRLAAENKRLRAAASGPPVADMIQRYEQTFAG